MEGQGGQWDWSSREEKGGVVMGSGPSMCILPRLQWEARFLLWAGSQITGCPEKKRNIIWPVLFLKEWLWLLCWKCAEEGKSESKETCWPDYKVLAREDGAWPEEGAGGLELEMMAPTGLVTECADGLAVGLRDGEQPRMTPVFWEQLDEWSRHCWDRTILEMGEVRGVGGKSEGCFQICWIWNSY